MLAPNTEGPGRSRPLTPTEVQVIRGLLGADDSTEREKIRKLGIPPRTYHAIRERAYLEGWVIDRYLPDLSVLGGENVTVAVVQPFGEHMSSVVKTWASDPRTVVLWVGPETVFGVFVEGAKSPKTVAAALAEGRSTLRRHLEITANTYEGGVPVYFDFEAAWSRWTGQLGSPSYPRPWVSRNPENENGRSLGANGGMSAVAGLVRRPFEVEARRESPLRASPFYAPRSQQKVLSRRLVQRRIFLDILRLPPFEGRAIERVVFVGGELLPGKTPEALFRQLVGGCRVSPFIFVTDHARILFAALSPGPRAGGAASQPRPLSVMKTLQDNLQSIEVIREPLRTLRNVVDHRYDRLCRGTS